MNLESSASVVTSAKLELADFEAALHSEFQMEPSDRSHVALTAGDIDPGHAPLADDASTTLPLILTQCKVKLTNSMQECFSLVFQAPAEAPQAQALYRLHHPIIGSASIFLVPFKRTEAGLFYEAIFNRLLG